MELPEGISIDGQGDMFVTLGPPSFVPDAGPGWVKRIVEILEAEKEEAGFKSLDPSGP